MILTLIALTIAGYRPVMAAEKTTEGQYLTKGEAVMMITATDFMKKKIGELLSWTIGYDVSKVSRVKLTPTINYVLVVPKRIPPDGRTVMELQASVDDPGGLNNIAGVRADLSSIGRLANTMLVDNGLYGDRRSADGIYTLQSSVASKVKLGNKDIPVAVANKKGWLAVSKVSLDVAKNPVIMEARLSPEESAADGRSQVTLTVKVDNPGRFEDLQDVTANLKSLGYRELLAFGERKENEFTLRFTVPAGVSEGTYPVVIEAANVAGGYASKELSLKVRR